MRQLFIVFFSHLVLFASAQHVGINTDNPQATLHVAGKLQVDSSSTLRLVTLKDSLDDERMVFNPDKGSLELWDNDTLWYSVTVASAPLELREGGNYTVERDWGNTHNGESAIVTTYKNADNDIVFKRTDSVVDDPEGDDELIINEIYEDGCLIEKTIQYGPSGGTRREIYECPSGDLCLSEVTVTNNSTSGLGIQSSTVLKDEKTGEILSEKNEGGLKLGKLFGKKSFQVASAGNVLMGGQEIEIGECAEMRMFGANAEGFSIKVSDLIINPVPGLQLAINEDEKEATFCNTKELEQKIDSTLRRRGIIDNALGTFSSRIQTPMNWLQGTVNPTTGLFIQSSSLSPYAYSRIYFADRVQTIVGSSTNSMSCTTFPATQLWKFEVEPSSIVKTFQWDSPNDTFMEEVENTDTSDKLTCSSTPSAGLMSMQASGITFRECQFDDANQQQHLRVVNSANTADITSTKKPEMAPGNSQWSVGSNQNNLNIQFLANLNVQGILSKLAGSFKIDHPLDPYNKYLVHSFVESPDMMNIYNGNVITDQDGIAIIALPDYFQALNIEPRYQLTVIGSFDQAIIYEEVSNNQFTIKSSAPNVKVSWQVTGIRNDSFAKENRLQAEVDKEKEAVGTLLYPGSIEK